MRAASLGDLILSAKGEIFLMYAALVRSSYERGIYRGARVIVATKENVRHVASFIDGGFCFGVGSLKGDVLLVTGEQE